MRIRLALAAAAAALVVATPATAASTATATANAKGTVLKSLSLTWASDLNFGTVAADALSPGTVSIDADSGAQTTTGKVVALSGATSRAEFDGLGDPNANVTLQLQQPNGGVICSGGASCPYTIPAVLTLDQTGSTTRTTDSGGKFTVFVGGTFSIAAAQQNGLYSSQFNLTAVYP